MQRLLLEPNPWSLAMDLAQILDIVAHLVIESHLQTCPDHHPKPRCSGLKEHCSRLRNSSEEPALAKKNILRLKNPRQANCRGE